MPRVLVTDGIQQVELAVLTKRQDVVVDRCWNRLKRGRTDDHLRPGDEGWKLAISRKRGGGGFAREDLAVSRFWPRPVSDFLFNRDLLHNFEYKFFGGSNVIKKYKA